MLRKIRDGRTRTRTAVALACAAALLLAILPGCAGRDEEQAGQKVLIFAVDAATWNIIVPLIDEGELPNIARLVSRGTYGILESGTPIQSPQMWTSIATGVVPEKHGITGFMAEMPGGKEVPVTSNLRKVKAFWNILSDHDVSVGIVGWWPSWPAEEVNGFMIAQRAWPVNWSRHGIPYGAERDWRGNTIIKEFPGRTYPDSLYAEFEPFIITEDDVTVTEIKRFFGGVGLVDPDTQYHATWVYAKDRTFANSGLEFYERYDPDVFAVYLQGTDVVSHYYWGARERAGFELQPRDAKIYGTVVDEYYKFADEVIGRFLEVAPEDAAVMIVSDHGFETKVDLVERWQRGEQIRTIEGNKNVPWDHAIDGVYIMAGPGIIAGHEGPRASVVDVTPTLLAYLGIPVGEDMDGAPIRGLFEREFEGEHPVQYVATHETGEPRGDDTPLESPIDEGIKEKLRSLGYIE